MRRRPGADNEHGDPRDVADARLRPVRGEGDQIADLDRSMQVRIGLSMSAVAEYAERIAEGDDFPNPTVFDDAGREILADGYCHVSHTLVDEVRKGLVVEPEGSDGECDQALTVREGLDGKKRRVPG